MTAIISTLRKPRLSLKAQTLWAIFATVSAVVLPQIFHVLGLVSGLGTSLGETFLPMHLPVMLVGLMAGPFAGAVAGFTAPLVSFALTGMPMAAMLPFMMVELCVYGLAGGLLKNSKMPATLKVLLTQIAGRAVRSLVILGAVYIAGYEAIGVSVIWTSITAGIMGIALQLVLIPLVLYRVEHTDAQ